MSQATSNLRHKCQRSSTPSRSNPQQSIDELNPEVEALITGFYQDHDDAQERDSTSDDDSNETEDNDTEDDERASVGNRREALREDERSENTVRHKQQPRINTFNGFKDAAHELLLLKALDVVRPFGVQHGQTGAAWLRVVRYLKDHDNKERDEGRPTVFDGVNPRVCQARWKNLSREYAEHEADMKAATGVNPQITDRLKHIQPVYEFEQACKQTADDNKDIWQCKKARTESNRVAGEFLLERSRTGPAHVPSDSPQLTQGFLSGTESESSVSIVSNYSPRTPGMRKRAMSTMLTGQIQEASDFLKSQVEYQKKQLDLILEDREERKEEREERKKMEEE
ncbi:hypothetical protein BGZ81_002606 [Podila clonocystis]|nr:hypothetical protein BGZ81_002606 [Podila clonocystis]